MDYFTKMNKRLNEVENIGRITNSNKDKIINKLNYYGKDIPNFEKISKDISVNDLAKLKKVFIEKQAYEVVGMAINRGNTIITQANKKILEKSQDVEVSRLGEYSFKLAKAQKSNLSKLNKNEKELIDTSNFNILGLGNKDIVSQFEKTSTKIQVEKLINTVSRQNPIDEFHDKNFDTLERVFQRVNIVRRDDLNKIKKYMEVQGVDKSTEVMNYLLKSLDMYGSSQSKYGKREDEQELLNNRVDDLLIKTGMKKGGQKKVDKIYKKHNKKVVE